jgi:hypothetical protein
MERALLAERAADTTFAFEAAALAHSHDVRSHNFEFASYLAVGVACVNCWLWSLLASFNFDVAHGFFLRLVFQAASPLIAQQKWEMGSV